MSVLFVLIIFILIIIAVVVGVVALATSSYRSGSAPVAPSAPVAAMPSSEERQAILKQLAQGEISKDQAKERLGALGTPVPVDMSTPEPRPASGRGCLIALLVGLILIPLILVMVFIFFGLSLRTTYPSSSSQWETSLEMPADMSQEERLKKVFSESEKNQGVILQETQTN